MRWFRKAAPVREKSTYAQQRNNWFGSAERIGGADWASYSHEVQEQLWLNNYNRRKGWYLENQSDVREVDEYLLEEHLARRAEYRVRNP